MHDLMGGSYGGYLATQALVIPAATAPNDETNEEEIIVLGATRTDPASSSEETARERANLHMFGGGYGNAEQIADGVWTVVATLLPKEDQARYEIKLAAVNTNLMMSLIPNEQFRIQLANALTDRSLTMYNTNMSALYQQYRSLLDSGQQTGGRVSDFVDWIERNQISSI